MALIGTMQKAPSDLVGQGLFTIQGFKNLIQQQELRLLQQQVLQWLRQRQGPLQL